MTTGGEGAEVAGGDDQAGTEERSEPGHGGDHLRLRVQRKHVGDLLVEGLESVALGQQVAGQLGDDLGRGLLSGQGRVLGLGGGDGAGCDVGVAADLTGPQPPRQPRLPGSADRFRSAVAAQQHQRALAGGEVELPLQGGEDAGQKVPKTVDHPHPIRDQIGPVAGENRQRREQVGVGGHRR